MSAVGRLLAFSGGWLLVPIPPAAKVSNGSERAYFPASREKHKWDPERSQFFSAKEAF
jgi:hypothetical protein